MKEVFFSSKKTEILDPIEILLKAGVPPEKITWIFMLRDPLQTFSSCEKYGDDILKQDPDDFASWQAHTITLWHKYKDSRVKVVPFVYELLKGQEERVLRKLFSQVGIETDIFSSLNLEFNRELIDKKLVPGQAADDEYFKLNLQGTVNKGRYKFTMNSYPVDIGDAYKVTALCQRNYEDFTKIAEKALDA